MQEFIAINEQRAEFYWWMSSLFATELTQENLDSYQSQAMMDYFSQLAMTEELTKPVTAFCDALAKQKKRTDGQLELAADFCGLFLTTPKTGALPYASIYIGKTGLLNDKPAQDMGKWMKKYSLYQLKEFNEPFDHLSLILDFMGNLIVMANNAEQKDKQEAMMKEQQAFLEQMLVPWIDAFEKKLLQSDAFGFYCAAASILSNFIKLDLLFLKGQ